MDRPNVKIEKVTLWIATPTYGNAEIAEGTTALDTIVPFLSGIDCDLALLDQHTEELKLEGDNK
jgi:hypothetical protein